MYVEQKFGDFLDHLPPCPEQLTLDFSPSNAPPQQRWQNNGISAEFLADYLVTCLPVENENENHQKKQAEIKNAVSFIANELLENAMKFSYIHNPGGTEVKLFFDKNRIIFFIKNSINPNSVVQFKQYIQTLLQSDPSELYINQLEKNAENHSKSGLGLLTMINDYSTKLGWKFEQRKDDQSQVTVTTMVQFSIET